MKSNRNLKRFVMPAMFLGLFGSCTSEYYQTKGDIDFNNYSYVKAIENYEKSLNKKESITVKAKIAEAYRFMNNTVMAEKYYEQTISEKDIQKLPLAYTQVLLENGKTEKAETLLDRYLSSNPNDKYAQSLKTCCRKSEQYKNDSDLYVVKEVNIPGLENIFSPVPFNNGLIISAEKLPGKNEKKNPWNGNSYQDLFFLSKASNGLWAEPILLKGTINSQYHEATPTFNQQGSLMFFTRSNYVEGKLNKDAQNINHLKTFYATLQEDQWTNVHEISFNSETYSTGHPSLSADGTTLFFTSDKPGGFGGTDIYYSKLTGSSWGDPINAGIKINTEGNEMFPYVSSDNKLYFASNGHIGLGGLDIFVSKINENYINEPKNIGYPINSCQDDFGIAFNPDNQSGYLSSSRFGNDRIFEFARQEQKFNLIGKVTDKNTGETISNCQIILINNNTKNKDFINSDEKGEYAFDLTSNSEFTVKCNNNFYYKISPVAFSIAGKTRSEVVTINFELEKIEMEKPIVLPNIYYELNKWILTQESKNNLDGLVKLMKENPAIYVELGSHTDSRASDKYNMNLSQKRAQLAVEYIVSSGIESQRLTAKGYGESLILNKCIDGVKCPEEEHTLNRRTEFKVVKIQNNTDLRAEY